MGVPALRRGGFRPQPLAQTLSANPVEDDLMVIHSKTRRSHALDSVQAFLQLKDSLALPADKMMVMSLVRPLVARSLPGYFHRHDMPFRRQGFQGAVDGSQPHPWNVFLREQVNLNRRERIEMLFQNGFNRLLLPGTSFHPPTLGKEIANFNPLLRSHSA